MTNNIVMLGRPGSGKGTQAELLSKKLNIPHISTGEIFRYYMEQNTTLGTKSREYVDSGNLVPDEILLEMLEERMSRADLANGYILDGTPRTLNQAEKIQIMFPKINRAITHVLYIYLTKDLMIKRLSGRWTCKAASHLYHELYNPPKIKGICDVDGSQLYQREDQTPEAIKLRIQKYENETAPLIEYYKKLGLLIQIEGDQSIEAVHEEITKNF